MSIGRRSRTDDQSANGPLAGHGHRSAPAHGCKAGLDDRCDARRIAHREMVRGTVQGPASFLKLHRPSRKARPSDPPQRAPSCSSARSSLGPSDIRPMRRSVSRRSGLYRFLCASSWPWRQAPQHRTHREPERRNTLQRASSPSRNTDTCARRPTASAGPHAVFNIAPVSPEDHHRRGHLAHRSADPICGGPAAGGRRALRAAAPRRISQRNSSWPLT